MKIILIVGISLFSLQIGLSQEKIYISTYSPAKLFIYNPLNRTLQEFPQDTAIVSGIGNNYFVIDTIHQRLYQTYRRKNLGAFVIASSNLDGSNRVIIKADSTFVADLAIDYNNNKLLWLENPKNKIMRSNLDGSMIEAIFDSLDNASGLVYNHENDKVYWSEYPRLVFDTKIYSVNKDGTNKEEIITNANLGTVGRLAIDYQASKLYWTADENRKIQRANYDGSDIEIVHNFTGQERPFGLYIDKKSNKLYWTDYGLDKVFRSDLNGVNKEEVISQGLKTPLSVFLYHNNINSTKSKWINNGLSLFPNPAGNNLYLKFNNVNNANLPTAASIHSIDGRYVQFFQINPLNMEVPINHLAKGIYILKIQFPDGSVAAEKFIKS